MTHAPEFTNWLLRHDPDYEHALSQADGHALAQYSDRIPRAPARALPITEAPEEWIDQNHRNMVQANTADTLKRMSPVERDHYNMQPLSSADRRLIVAVVIIAVVLVVWAAVWIGGKL